MRRGCEGVRDECVLCSPRLSKGTHPSLKSSEDARAIVTGIINGTGSLGQCGYTNYLCACIDVLVWVLLGTPPSLPWGLPFPYLGGGGLSFAYQEQL